MSRFTRNEFWAAGSFFLAIVGIAVGVYIWKNPIPSPAAAHDFGVDIPTKITAKPAKVDEAIDPSPGSMKKATVPGVSKGQAAAALISKRPAAMKREESVELPEPIIVYDISQFDVIEKMPNEDQLAYVPPEYRDDAFEGFLFTTCVVNSDGRLTKCTFNATGDSESLKGFGRIFAKSYRVGPLMKSGKPSAGVTVSYKTLLGASSAKWRREHPGVAYN
ncbi:hypothetical protein [Caulobacter sp. X]|uniref:hypothetical protein n=1 Tax=Caulobacter sp. X TaxID=2048901 RepID=UPI0011782CAB|nr:hypothetical protein [Caulobacter sp. X]